MICGVHADCRNQPRNGCGVHVWCSLLLTLLLLVVVVVVGFLLVVLAVNGWCLWAHLRLVLRVQGISDSLRGRAGCLGSIALGRPEKFRILRIYLGH